MNISPPPWKLTEIDLYEGGEGIEIVDANGDVVVNNQTYYPQALDHKNASIISAAPDMLRALEETRPVLRAWIKAHPQEVDILDHKADLLIEFAIKKAKGEIK